MRGSVLIIIISFLLTACKKEAQTGKKPVNSETETAAASAPEKQPDSTAERKIIQERFDFITELCDNKGYFDSNKYSRKEIEGTYRLWFNSGAFHISTPSVFKPDDLYKVRREKDLILEKLDADFLKKKTALEKLTVVSSPYWQNIKKAHLAELKEDYEKNRLQMIAYSDPSVLLNNSFTKNCQNFAKALSGSDEAIISEWRKLREAMSKKNANPGRIMAEFEDHAQSSQWKDFAVADLITFGWGNCANQDVQRPSHDDRMNKEFEALFIKIDSECDEP